MKNTTVNKLIHHLEVFVRENPSWADADVMVVCNYLLLKKGTEIQTVDLEENFQDLLKNSS